MLKEIMNKSAADNDAKDRRLKNINNWLEMVEDVGELKLELQTFQDVIAGGVLIRKKSKTTDEKVFDFAVYSEEGKLKQLWTHASIDGRSLKRLNHFDHCSPLTQNITKNIKRKRINEVLGINEFLRRKAQKGTKSKGQG